MRGNTAKTSFKDSNLVDFQGEKVARDSKIPYNLLESKSMKEHLDIVSSSILNNHMMASKLSRGIGNTGKNLGYPANLRYNESKKNSKDESKGDEDMNNVNWQEKYLDNLDNNMREINENLSNTEARISEMINKHIDNSIHLDKQRHEENLKLNDKIDKSISDISSEFKTTNKWIVGLAVSTIISVGALVITAITAIKQ